MLNIKLHTPIGVRDILPMEAMEKKRFVQELKISFRAMDTMPLKALCLNILRFFLMKKWEVQVLSRCLDFLIETEVHLLLEVI